MEVSLSIRKVVITCLLFSTVVFANQDQTIGGMANMLRGSFSKIASLMIALSYVAGIGFGITSIFKFKQHKDNPQQVPIGTPFAMMAISVLLIFLPAIYAPAGISVFGTTEASGSTGGRLEGLPGDDVTPAAAAQG
jgi:intracellular multiplication protein IcmD